DPRKGMKFITYAVWWIRQRVRRALYDKSRIVRLPQNRLQQIRRTMRVVESLEKKFKRKPTTTEISQALGNEEHTFWNAAKYLQFQQYLDTPLDHDNKNRLVNIIADASTSPPDAGLKRESLKKEIKIALRVLNNRERVILQLLYGLGGSRPLTLGEVGEPFGLSRERVRQIRNEALVKLRRTKQVRNNLREYLG
ncbi:MAG: sigma-70 family RNA polymerase sigma factor, partial [bacterium]